MDFSFNQDPAPISLVSAIHVLCHPSSGYYCASSSGDSGEGPCVSINHCKTPEIHVIFPSQKAQFTGSQELTRRKRPFHFLPSVKISQNHPYKPLRIIPELSYKVCRSQSPDIQLSLLGSHILNIDPSGSLILRTLKYDTPLGSSPVRYPVGGGSCRR